MKKLTRKLFISVMTLVLTAMALGTTTFAWFSMNTSVTATGMNVTAKSDALFLLIGNSSTTTATQIQGAGATPNSQITVAGIAKQQDGTTDHDTKVFPAYYAAVSSNLYGTDTTAGSWYSGTSDSYNNATSNASIALIAPGTNNVNYNDYMVRYDFYLTLSADSEPQTKNIVITPSKGSGFTDVVDALSCVITINGETHNWVGTATTGTTAMGNAWTTANTVSLTNADVVQVTVLVYINGESAATTSANLSKLAGALQIAFSLAA